MSVKNVLKSTLQVSILHAGIIVGAFVLGYALGGWGDPATALAAEAESPSAEHEARTVELGPPTAEQPAQVFELRTYTAAEGKYDDLLARFRDHTMRIFEKHGMSNVGYWTPQDAPLSENTLVYLISHPSRDAADEAWQAFGADPEWQSVFRASRSDGPLIANLESVYLDPTDFSPMK